MIIYNPLKVCPPSPNCVCTIETHPKKYMQPLTFSTTAAEAQEAIRKMILGMSRTRLLEERVCYLHFEFKTFWGGFKDDVEFYFDEEGKAIHFRSASRVGYSDLGANRRRMGRVGKKWKGLGVVKS